MRTFIEATLVLTISVGVTLFVLVAVFPGHPLGANDIAFDAPVVSPAVFVEDMHDRPGSFGERMGTRSRDGSGSEQCPYLAALAAADSCPALPQISTVQACPYLREIHRRNAGEYGTPVRVSGQDI
jgi:hypothetical protein